MCLAFVLYESFLLVFSLALSVTLSCGQKAGFMQGKLFWTPLSLIRAMGVPASCCHVRVCVHAVYVCVRVRVCHVRVCVRAVSASVCVCACVCFGNR